MRLSTTTFGWLRDGIGNQAAAREIESALSNDGANNFWFVDGQAGADGGSYDGKSWNQPFATLSEAFDNVTHRDVIFARGDFREHTTAPQDIYGVRIIGASPGRPRHSTENGTVLTGLATSWREAATAGNAPLLTLREQGWEIYNFLMVPQSGYSAIKLHRTEAAAAQDASHAIIKFNKFISSGTRVGYGIEDYGGAYHILVEDNEFVNLEFAYNPTNVSIASPSAQEWRRNKFDSNKHDIVMNSLANTFEDNRFQTVYHATTHPNTLNLAYTADAGSATRKNLVLNNYFADAAADVTIAKGYKPGTGDIWRNYVTDTADQIVTVPA